MRTVRYGLAGAWAGGVIALLYCAAVGTAIGAVFNRDIPKGVAFFLLYGAILGFLIGVVVAPRGPSE